MWLCSGYKSTGYVWIKGSTRQLPAAWMQEDTYTGGQPGGCAEHDCLMTWLSVHVGVVVVVGVCLGVQQ